MKEYLQQLHIMHSCKNSSSLIKIVLEVCLEMWVILPDLISASLSTYPEKRKDVLTDIELGLPFDARR